MTDAYQSMVRTPLRWAPLVLLAGKAWYEASYPWAYVFIPIGLGILWELPSALLAMFYFRKAMKAVEARSGARPTPDTIRGLAHVELAREFGGKPGATSSRVS